MRKLYVSLIKIMIFMEMDASTIDKGMKTVQPRVIEGFSATEGVFTWMVALYFKGTYVCSASLISDRLVLTAAHCIVHDNIIQKAEDFIGHMGSVNKSSPTLRVEFHSLRIHPDYNSKNLTADVAIMVTKQKISLEEFGSVKRICLFAEAKEKKREMLGMGWGSTSALLSIIPETLQVTWLNVIQNIFCSVVQWTMTNETLCMGAINKGICQGDSGGPLIDFNERGIPYQVAIASYVGSILGCGKLSLYTRIYSYKDFIIEAGKEFQTSVCFLSYIS